MQKPLIIIAIIAILIVVGFLLYKTFLRYQYLIKEGGPLKEGLPSASENPPANQGGENEVSGKGPQVIMEKPLEGKSIVMLIAFKDFRDEEYFIPKQIFLAAGVKTVLTASTRVGTAIGADGGEVPVNLLIKDINVADFDAVVFIGGPGALKELDNENSYRVVRDTISQGKLLSAICISPAILAKAGALRGKKATVWTSSMDKSAVKILEDNGAIFEDKSVVADGLIITGNGPSAAEEFAMKIIELLL